MKKKAKKSGSSVDVSREMNKAGQVLKAGETVTSGLRVKGTSGAQANSNAQASSGAQAGSGVQANSGAQAGSCVQSGSCAQAGSGVKANPSLQAGPNVKDSKRGKVGPDKGVDAADTSAAEQNPDQQSDFAVVGVGASAGGLEALKEFFRNVPERCGVAFVVVTHLDPTHKAMMAELLQRSTSIPVIEITDGMQIEPDHVYVIPPNKNVSLVRGLLHLFVPTEPRGLRLPINFFLRSLADDQFETSAAVILSGMGSDGTLGAGAIKERGGGTFVQLPASAKFDSMPRSVIDSGFADVVAPAGDLPGKLLGYFRAKTRGPKREGKAELASRDDTSLDKVLGVLRLRTGHDFSNYKASTLYRRIDRRMGLAHLNSIADYALFLRENAAESELLFKELLIGVTSFFRDPAVWAQLRDEVLPTLIQERLNSAADSLPNQLASGTFTGSKVGGHLTLRAWVPGCSTGEEAFSLAMVFKEVVGRMKPNRHVTLQIFATDLDKDAIDRARAAVYLGNITGDVSQDRLRRFFIAEQSKYRVNGEIREMVIFAQQNLVMDPPFTRLDLLLCRNLLIYLEPELQRTLMPLFHYSLKPGGALLLGTAETVGLSTDLFTALPGKNRIYRRLNTTQKTQAPEFSSVLTRPLKQSEAGEPLAPISKAAAKANSVHMLTEKLLLAKYCPAGVLVTELGDIIYISGKTGQYLEPAAGKVNWNLIAMARGRIAYELIEALPQAVRKKTTVKISRVDTGEKDSKTLVDIIIQPLTEPEALRGMVLVVFNDVGLIPPGKAPGKEVSGSKLQQSRLAALAQQLQVSRDELRTVREEMVGSQEELKSANEELQSTNEECQSSNEELTTSKEEMQSMNEELQTVNHELQAKVDELSRASNDMNNLLNSTDIATLFLDEELHVRRFTNQVANIIKLISSDAGRLITDIATTLNYPALAEDARKVLRTLVFTEKQITDRDGRWFMVRIMPYRTHDNKIDGVVITFSDISVAKKLEVELRAAQARLTVRLTDQTAELGQANKELKAEIDHRTTAEAEEEAGKQPAVAVSRQVKEGRKKGKGE